MTSLSKTSFGRFGLEAFAIGIVCLATSPISDWLLYAAPCFWLLGLGCGIASRTGLIGKVALWTNAGVLTLLALFFIWIYWVFEISTWP